MRRVLTPGSAIPLTFEVLPKPVPLRLLRALLLSWGRHGSRPRRRNSQQSSQKMLRLEDMVTT